MSRAERVEAAARAYHDTIPLGDGTFHYRATAAALTAGDALFREPEAVERVAKLIDKFTKMQFNCYVTYEARDALARAVTAALLGDTP